MSVVQKVDTTSIVKLNGKNYMPWRFQVNLMLAAADVLPVVIGTEPRPGAEPEAWIKKDDRAKNLIVSTLEQSQLALVYQCLSANDMWLKLKSAHDDQSEFTKQRLLNEFYNYTIPDGKLLVEAFTEIELMVASLRDMGETISESSAVAKIVAALPAKYKPFKSAWDSVEDKRQTLVNLLQRLKKEDAEQCVVDNSNKVKTKAFSAHPDKSRKGGSLEQRKKAIDDLKKRTRCRKCDKIGHWQKEC
jgi:hypothetical protein